MLGGALVVLLPWYVHAKQLQTDSLYSERLGRSIGFTVALPRSYTTEGAREQRYPVVYLLHCAGCTGPLWFEQQYCGDLGELLDRFDIIAVAPDDGQVLSWWLDSPLPGRDSLSAFLALDLVAHIDSTFRTRAQARYRGLAGHSMGGFGALHNLLEHPAVFASAFSIKGAVDLMPYGMHWGLPQLLGTQESNYDNWKRVNVLDNAARFPSGGVAIGFYAGESDWFYHDNRRLADTLAAHGKAHVYLDAPAFEQHYPLDPVQMERVMAFFDEFFRTGEVGTSTAPGTDRRSRVVPPRSGGAWDLRGRKVRSPKAVVGTQVDGPAGVLLP